MGNSATDAFGIGGGIRDSAGTANIVNSTIADNSAGFGGGINIGIGTPTLTNTIVSGNTASLGGNNVIGSFTDNGGNVVDGDDSLIFGSNVLADNGGPVQTVALVNHPTNPALDVGQRTGAAANGQVAVDFAGVDNDADGSEFGDAGAYELMCFAVGTRIATPDGETPVETLRIGDLVTTQDQRAVPVTWIGRQTASKWRHGPHMQPVRIRAGALGDGLPHSDLTVTADHGMIIDGFVITASALVNGSTIAFVPMDELEDSFIVYHIETEAHDVILANGAPAETFIDYLGRTAFDNYAEYLDLYGAERIIPEIPLPRIAAPRLVPQAIRDRLGAAADKARARAA